MVLWVLRVGLILPARIVLMIMLTDPTLVDILLHFTYSRGSSLCWSFAVHILLSVAQVVASTVLLLQHVCSMDLFEV